MFIRSHIRQGKNRIQEIVSCRHALHEALRLPCNISVLIKLSVKLTLEGVIRVFHNDFTRGATLLLSCC